MKDFYIKFNDEEEVIDTEKLRSFIDTVIELNDVLSHLNFLYDSVVVEAIATFGGITLEELANETLIREKFEQVRLFIEKNYPDRKPIDIEIDDDSEHSEKKVTILTTISGVIKRTLVDFRFATMKEIEKVVNLVAKLNSFGLAPFSFGSKEKDEEFGTAENWRDLLELLMNHARSGYKIQRYKF